MNLALSKLGRLRWTVAVQEDRRREPPVKVALVGGRILGLEVDEVRR